ncbi:MAG: IS1182 family transposase [Myxococcales bacterium]|nr:IS1182 family transposase [Myxococcales bacterium]
MKKQYRSWAPEQAYLLPPSPLEWLPEGHLAFFVLEVVRELDLGAIETALQAKDPRGERPYSPRMMTGLILYGYCTGVFSSRKIERATHEDVPFRVIAGGAHPHFTTVNEFRLVHRMALAGLFTQVLTLCSRAGLKTLGHVSLDGSKVQANASKHKAMSYGRMKTDEKRLAEEVEGLLRRAEEIDAREDSELGPNSIGDEIPVELRHRETRLKRIRELKAELEKEAAEERARQLKANAVGLEAKVEEIGIAPKARKEAAALAKRARKKAEELSPPRNDDDDDDDGSGGTQLSLHRVPVTADGKPKDKAQRNFTDGDSRIMIRNGVFMQAYNAQALVSEDQIIVAHGVTNNGADTEQLMPMLNRMRESAGAMATELTADNGYLSEENAEFCARNGVDAFVSLRKKDAERRDFPPTMPGDHFRFAMQMKLASARGRELYPKRKVIVEPVFGQVKGAMGFRRFSLRGLLKVPSEWAIVSTCHNLLKLFRAGGINGLTPATM